MHCHLSSLRKLEAPIEDKFQRQDEQMQHMCEVMEREIKSLYDNMQRLEETVEEQKHVIEANMETTASEFHAMKAETNQQFQTMADVFKESLSSATKAHDGMMSAQFNEIKSMIAAGSSIKSPPPKRPRSGGGDDDSNL